MGFSPSPQAVRKVLQKFEDAFLNSDAPLRRLQKAVKKLGGIFDEEAMNPYRDINLSKGSADNSINKFEKIEATAFEFASAYVTKLAGNDWRGANGEKLSAYEALTLYMRACDMVEAQELGLKDRGREGFIKKTGKTPSEFTLEYEGKVGLRDPEAIKTMWENWRAMNEVGMRAEIDAGIITEETYREMQRDYYVPQRGWEERDLKEYADEFNLSTEVAKGRASLSADPIAYAKSIVHSSILRAEKNKVKRQLLELVEKNRELGEANGIFNLREVYEINDGVDSNGNVIWTQVDTKPDAELFKADKATRREQAKLRRQAVKLVEQAEALEAEGKDSEALAKRVDAEKKTKQATSLDDAMNVRVVRNNDYKEQRTDKEAHDFRMVQRMQSIVNPLPLAYHEYRTTRILIAENARISAI
jgi:hypothetical protein